MQVSQRAETAASAAPKPPSACRCGGTGVYTVDITLADAVVSDQRICVEHGLRPKTRVYDSTKGCVGEVMEVVKHINGYSVWLRPTDGGTEWKTTVGALQPLQATP